MKSSHPCVGVIGGLGPLAGVNVTSKIFQYAAEQYGAVEDYEYPDLVLISRGIAGFDNQGALADDFELDIVRIAGQLNEAGASVIGVACNTAHLFYESLCRASAAPVVNLVDEVVTAIGAQDTKPLLLSSSTTQNTKLYTTKLDAKGIAYVSPDWKIQKLVDQAIHLVMSHKLAKAGQKIDAIISQAGSGFDCIVVACTELPLAFAYSKAEADYPVIDSSQILAQRLTDHYYQALESSANLLNWKQ